MTTGSAAPHDSDWQGVRLHVVTGKGGTGKTTVAAALALALASQGKRVLLVEVEGRQGDQPDLRRHPARAHRGPHRRHAEHGGEVFGLSVDAKAALLEYLQIFYKLGRAGGLLEKFGAVDFATTIAPGVRDVLLTGKVYEAVRRRRDPKAKGPRAAPAYDAVVLDAPPTGRIVRFLNVNPRSPGSPRSARSAARPTRSRRCCSRRRRSSTWSPCSRRCRSRRPSTPSATCVPPASARRRRGQPGPRAAAAGGSAHGRRPHAGSTTRWSPPTSRRSGCGRATPWCGGLLAEARDHADRVSLERTEERDRRGAGAPDLPAAAPGRRHRRRRDPRARRPADRPGDGLMARTTTTTGSRSRAPKAPPLDIDDLIDDPNTRIIVCCGSGGVGKTTTAAALGLRAAERAARSSSSRSTRRGAWPSRSASAARQRAPAGHRHRHHRRAARSTR